MIVAVCSPPSWMCSVAGPSSERSEPSIFDVLVHLIVVERLENRLAGDRPRRCAGGCGNARLALSMITLLGQPGGSLGRRDLENSAQVEIETDEDLVAGGDVGQSVDEELTHHGVEPDVLVLALEDADLGRVLAVVDRPVDLGTGGGQGRVARG